MANKCYNRFSFFGNAKVAKQVEIWYSELREVASTEADSQSVSILFEVFFPGDNVINAIPYLGVKWAYPDFGESIPLEAGEIGFVSAWSAMDGFQDHLTEVLGKMDKNLVVLLSSKTDAYEEAARYSAIGLDGKIISESAYLSYDEDDEEKENPKYTLFYEHMRDSCDDLIGAVPGIKSRLKVHLKFLDDAFDESLRG